MFLALMSCGDYYCDESHPVGIYSTNELAERAQEDALLLKRPTTTGGDYQLFSCRGDILEIELDQLPKFYI